MEGDSDTTRLNKFLALQLGVSRREADILIDSGTVTVNGTPAVLGGRIREGDDIAVAGKPISSTASDYIYLMFHKPVGYVCSRRAQGDNPTIYDLIPNKYHALKPVGRLDRDSSGILVLTNDGDFAYKMTHPKFAKTKVYEVRLNKDLEPLHQQMVSDFGINLNDGRSQLTLARIDDNRRDIWQVTMSEGRNRQIRRTFGSIGYDVVDLHRIQFGNYSLGDMKPGEIQIVNMR